MRILGIDPGETSGVALWDVDKQELINSTTVKSEGQAIIAYRWFAANMPYWKSHDIVIENFIGSGPLNKHAHFTIRLIGFLEGSFERTYLQVPGARKPFMSRALKLGVHPQHEADALAHALAHERKWYGQTD